MSSSCFLSCCTCLKLTSAFPWNPLLFTSPALGSAFFTEYFSPPLSLLPCRVISVRAPAGWVSVSLFSPLIEAQLCMQLPQTISTVQVLGSPRFLNCVLPSICYESKGWSSSKQSVLTSSTFLLLMVTAAAAALRCSVYPKPLSNSVFLLL